jgi:anthranilate phosphoribosyltransferase
VTSYRIAPEDFGYHGLDAADLAGGDPAANAALIAEVIEGKRRGAARAAVAMNAGAAIYVAGRADSLADGINLAEQLLTDGMAAPVLDRLRSATNRRRQPS